MFVRIINIIFLFSLFLSSSGIILNQHFCGNRLQDYSLFIQVNGCNGAHKAVKKTGCAKHSTPMDNGCCKDKTEYFKLDQDQQLEHFELKEFSTSLPVPACIYTNLAFHLQDKAAVPEYLSYKPPLLICDTSPLLQVFLL